MKPEQLNKVESFRKSYIDGLKAKFGTDDRGNAKRPRKVWYTYNVSADRTTCGELTDTATAYIRYMAGRFAFTAVKTVHAKEATPFIERLFFQGCSWMKDNAHDEMRDNIAQRDGMQMQRKVTHRKEKRNGVFVEIMPYDTLEMTDNGREYNSIDSRHGSEFEDLVGVAALALLEMVDNGLIASFDSVWNMRREVYKAVNKYLHSERGARISNEQFANMCLICEDGENGYNETVLYGRMIDNHFHAIEKKEIIIALNQCIAYHFSKRYSDNDTASKYTEKYIELLEMLYNGMTEREIASNMNITQRAVHKKVVVLRNICNELFNINMVKVG